jgi:sugar lactone lactonase YvrE
MSRNHSNPETFKLEARKVAMLISEVDLAVDANAVIGESPLWCKEQGTLYWIDVKAPALYRTELASLETTPWPLPSDIGGFALKSDAAGAIVALRNGMFGLDFASGKLAKLFDAPFDLRTHRFNEADCDSNGRLWIGTMFDPNSDARSAPTKGNLYSFTANGGLLQQDDRSLLHNGFAWTPDGKEFFLAHSRQGRIYTFAFDVERGRLGRKRVFAEIPQALGIPDGGAFDEHGCYWCAIHRGGRLHRYAPDGRLDAVVELPVQNPTMMAFCGPDLRDLYVTSATHGMPGKPHEGGIFHLRTDVPGLARRPYVC